MTDGQEPGKFTKEVYYLRDELLNMGEVYNDDSILDIVLTGLTDEYIKNNLALKQMMTPDSTEM